MTDRTIFDIGMHTGEDTDFYLKKGFRVVGVEADPALCQQVAARHPGEIADGSLVIVNKAISETDAPLRFFLCRTKSAWSTASPDLRDRWRREGAEFDEILVEGMSAGELVKRFGAPYYAKIDIEGLDLVCLKALADAGASPQFVSVEVDFYRHAALIGLLKIMGYQRFALVDQSAIEAQRPPSPAREGLPIDHTFGKFSSGLFGEELPQQWTDARALEAQCRRVIEHYRASGVFWRIGRVAPKLKTVVDGAAKAWFPLGQAWYDVHATL